MLLTRHYDQSPFDETVCDAIIANGGVKKRLVSSSILNIVHRHHCKMVQTRHYDQRAFAETVCDAIIANGGVKNHQKRCKMFAMMDASNIVQILVACAMQGIRFSSINCLGWGGTKEMGSQMKACAIYSIRFTRMNYVWLGNTMETVQLNKMCVIRGKQVRNQKCVRRPIITQTIAVNKPCDLVCLQ